VMEFVTSLCDVRDDTVGTIKNRNIDFAISSRRPLTPNVTRKPTPI
jgi:hypothetical protein